MSRFRVFLLWLAMLAVPFQGYAAATMALCGTAHAPETQAAAREAHMDHSAHDRTHDAHASHASDTAHDASGHAPHHADASSHSIHKCTTCSACHTIALMDVVPVAALAPLPQADLAEPSLAMATLPPRVLDKPPRA
jgi:hypothetical protein